MPGGTDSPAVDPVQFLLNNHGIMGNTASTPLTVAGILLDMDGVLYVGGDLIDSDIGGGQDSGLMGVLVRTGKYRADYCRRSAVDPDRTIDSIADLPGLLSI